MSIIKHKTEHVVFIKPGYTWGDDYDSARDLVGVKRKMVLGERDDGMFIVRECLPNICPLDLICEEVPSIPRDSWEYQDDWGVRILKLVKDEDLFLFKLGS